MEACLVLFEELKNILKNLKKQPNRKYKKSTLKFKKQRSKALYEEIFNILINLDENQQNQLLPSLRNTLFEITSFIDTRLEYKTLISLSAIARAIAVFLNLFNKVKSKIQGNMAKVDIKLGTSLITNYDGSPDTLDAFVDSVELFYQQVLEENATASQELQNKAKDMVVKLLRTRLTGVAHQIIHGLSTVEEIIKTLKEQCASKISSDSILAKMKALQQNAGIEKYCGEVEKLHTLLKNVYIKDTIPTKVASQMALKAAIETLISGVRNAEVKLILKAGKFETLSEAVIKVLEYGSAQPPKESSVLITNARGHNPRRGENYNRHNSNRNQQRNFQRNSNNNNFDNNYNRSDHYRDSQNFRTNQYNQNRNNNYQYNQNRNNNYQYNQNRNNNNQYSQNRNNRNSDNRHNNYQQSQGVNDQSVQSNWSQNRNRNHVNHSNVMLTETSPSLNSNISHQNTTNNFLGETQGQSTQ